MRWISYAERLVKAVWRYHFHIHWGIYLVGMVLSMVFFSVASTAAFLTGLFFLALSTQGLARWWWHRRSSSILVIPRFSVATDSDARAKEVQRIVMASLADHLSPKELSLVHQIPATVSRDRSKFAAWLRNQLRCHLLVFGRIAENADGSYSVFAGTMQAVTREVTHLDLHLRDATSAKGRWGWLFQRLTPSQTAIETEYPFEFAGEMEAVVRGISGMVKGALGDADAAEKDLREAIAIAPTSRSHQIDELRISLAKAVMETQDIDAGLEILRRRMRHPDPSPELLRVFDTTVTFRLMDPELPPDDRLFLVKEAETGLRAALDDRADPQRDITIHNLAMRLQDLNKDEEALGLLLELTSTSTFYKRSWYVARSIGAAYWHKGEFRLAAHWYELAIRRRPKAKWIRVSRFRIARHRIPRQPVLYANCVDAFREAGQDRKMYVYERRFQRARAKLMKSGFRALKREELGHAWAYFDWVSIVGRKDDVELLAAVVGEFVAAELEEAQAFERFQDVANSIDRAGAEQLRAEFVSQPH